MISPDIDDAARSLMPDVVAVEVEPFAGGSSAFVALVRLRSASGHLRHVVFRQHADRSGKGHAETVASKEYHLTTELAAAGFEVPKPLVLHGAETIDGPWLLTEWVDGSTAVAASDVDTALTRMADFLARLHCVDVSHLGVPGLADIEDPLLALSTYLPQDEIGSAIAATLDAGMNRRPNAHALLHGDFWPGNVLFSQCELVAVLDWEDAALGDPLADLACARVELECAYGDRAADRFTGDYLRSMRRLDRPLTLADLPLWDIYVSATALSAMHRWGLPPEEEAVRRSSTRRFFDAAAGRLIEGAADPADSS